MKVNVNELIEPELALASLSDGQRAVMDLVCEDFSYKEIAHRFDISVRTVEQRMASVRTKLHTYDRASTSRAYRNLKLACGQTTYGSAPLDFESLKPLTPFLDAGSGPVFTLSDSAFGGDEWVSGTPAEFRPRGDEFWGRVYRFGVIVLIAIGIAASVALVVAAANGLNDLL